MVRHTRYAELFSPSLLTEYSVLLVGVGSVGRRLAILLAELGFTKVIFIDPDKVSPENYGPQGYSPTELNSFKVDALFQHISSYVAPDSTFVGIRGSFDKDTLQYLTRFDTIIGDYSKTIFINCSDSMDVRSLLYAQWKDSPSPLFLDSRQSIETSMAFAAQKGCFDPYSSTLFPAHEAEQLPCSLKSSPHCSSTSATLLLTLITHFFRNLPLPTYLCMNLTAFDLEVKE